MKCEHELAEKDTAIADGMCPLCLAAELDALEAIAKAARKLMQEAIENCEICRGSIDCARCQTFDAFLKAGEK